MVNTGNFEDKEPITTIIDAVKSGKIMFPEFQRDFVWDIDKTLDLFDSLVRGIFIGSIIYGIPQDDLYVKEIDCRPRKTAGKRRRKLEVKKLELGPRSQVEPPNLVLDGQQRITSLYRALVKDNDGNDIDEVWFTAKKPCEIPELSTDGITCNAENWNNELGKKVEGYKLESLLYEFSRTESEDRLSIKLSDVYDIHIHQNKLVGDTIEKEYFHHTAYYKTVLKNLDEDIIKSSNNLYAALILKLMDLIKGFEGTGVVSYFLLNMSTEKFAAFFERSNSRGVHLSFIDILVAKLYTNFNLKKKIDEYNSDKTSATVKLKEETLIRAVAYIASDGKYIDKNYILKSLTAEHFNQNWDSLIKLYDEAISYLVINNYMQSVDWIPYDYMLIPLMMFIDNLPSKKCSEMTSKQKRFIDYWYWSTGLFKRYSSSMNETIVQDCQQLTKLAKNEKLNEQYVRKLGQNRTIQEPADLIDEKARTTSPLYKAFMSILCSEKGTKGIRSWKSGSRADNEPIDSHHIFPKEYLNDDEVYVESMVNRVFLPKPANIKIGKKKPSKYLSEYVEKAEDSSKFIALLKKLEMMPEELLQEKYDSDFTGYLNQRASNIYFNIIKKEVLDLDESIQREFT